MMITQTMTAEAEAAAVRYGMVVDGWRAIYQRELDMGDFGSAKQMKRITDQAYAIGRQFLETEAQFIEEVASRIAREAQGAALSDLKLPVADDLTEAATAHLNDTKDYLLHEITIQIERDIAFLKESIRKAALQVAVAARARNLPIRTALLQYRIGNASELHFFFHDRRNQKWPSRKFIRAVWRHSLLSIYNEVVLLTLADHGIDQAQVQHVNTQANSHGLIISMSSGTSLPTYAEIRNELFHPNSDAILAMVSE